MSAVLMAYCLARDATLNNPKSKFAPREAHYAP